VQLPFTEPDTSSLTEIERAQAIRLADVFLYGPAWMAQVIPHERTVRERAVLVFTGVSTLVFNLRNFIRFQNQPPGVSPIVRKTQVQRLFDIPLALFWLLEAYNDDPSDLERLLMFITGAGTTFFNGIAWATNQSALSRL